MYFSLMKTEKNNLTLLDETYYFQSVGKNFIIGLDMKSNKVRDWKFKSYDLKILNV